MSNFSSNSPAARTGPNIPLVIACGCIIALISFGPRSAMGLFFQPMTEARDWSRELFALAIAIQNLMWGLGQPVAGMMSDRYGTWKTITVGALLYASGLFMMVDAQSAVALHVSAGVLVGLGVAFSSFSIVLAAFGRVVTPEQRSIAFGIGTASGSLGQFLFAPLGGTLIQDIGWQNTLIVFSGLMLLLPLLAAALRGRSAAPAAQPGVVDQNLRSAIAEAFGTRGFVLLTIGFFVCGFHVAFITVHLPPYIADLALDPAWGATAIALIGLFNIAGSLISGYVGGRYSKPIFLALIYLARAVAIFLFIMIPATPLTVLVFAAVMGLLWLSTVPPTSGLVAVMFGPRYMGTLFGFVFLSHQIGSFLGVWLGGKLYDETGSYDAIWWMGIALGIAAAIIHWPIQEKPVDRIAQQAAE
ncbi:putative MFS family arabinose efflux permease [Roseibium hamelinense]|uniref:Putative MFS family arabinose efflux permease n=1 Tax=Roseibium hamelinense TaxID=150831 RepID=A0A562T3W5_9HYPH|nr:MFS transporter [Roseibium hamelinense]MTI42299.1 MFS transporter [Roseibium hamelinense]TWI87680.1 putative MFS family arabinose efflux permease [Roseibium hamelinense]